MRKAPDGALLCVECSNRLAGEEGRRPPAEGITRRHFNRFLGAVFGAAGTMTVTKGPRLVEAAWAMFFGDEQEGASPQSLQPRGETKNAATKDSPTKFLVSLDKLGLSAPSIEGVSAETLAKARPSPLKWTDSDRQLMAKLVVSIVEARVESGAQYTIDDGAAAGPSDETPELAEETSSADIGLSDRQLTQRPHSTGTLEKMSIRNTIKLYRPSIFEVCQKTGSKYDVLGSGFLIANDLVVTCNHVVAGTTDDALGVRYHLNANNNVAAGHYAVRGVHRFEHDDLAFLEVKQAVGAPHRSLILGVNTDVEVGEDVYSAGYPLGDAIQTTQGTRVCFVSRGIVAGEATDVQSNGAAPLHDIRRNLVLDITAHPGCSGAPVFLPNGTVVGVLNAGHPVFAASELEGTASERIGIGHALAIPVDHVNARLSEVRATTSG